MTFRNEKNKNSHTYKAISVFRSGTASSTFPVAAVADVGPVAPSITLLGTHRLGYLEEEGKIIMSETELRRVLFSCTLRKTIN